MAQRGITYGTKLRNYERMYFEQGELKEKCRQFKRKRQKFETLCKTDSRVIQNMIDAAGTALASTITQIRAENKHKVQIKNQQLLAQTLDLSETARGIQKKVQTCFERIQQKMNQRNIRYSYLPRDRLEVAHLRHYSLQFSESERTSPIGTQSEGLTPSRGLFSPYTKESVESPQTRKEEEFSDAVHQAMTRGEKRKQKLPSLATLPIIIEPAEKKRPKSLFSNNTGHRRSHFEERSSLMQVEQEMTEEEEKEQSPKFGGIDVKIYPEREDTSSEIQNSRIKREKKFGCTLEIAPLLEERRESVEFELPEGRTLSQTLHSVGRSVAEERELQAFKEKIKQVEEKLEEKK